MPTEGPATAATLLEGRRGLAAVCISGISGLNRDERCFPLVDDMNSQQFECSATPGKPRRRAQSATRRDLLAALEQPDPHGAFKVTGDIGTSRTLILDTPVASPERYCAAVNQVENRHKSLIVRRYLALPRKASQLLQRIPKRFPSATSKCYAR